MFKMVERLENRLQFSIAPFAAMAQNDGPMPSIVMPMTARTPSGHYKGTMSIVGVANAQYYPKDHPTIAIKKVGKRYQARIYGSAYMEFTAGYMDFKGKISGDKLKLVGTTFSTDAYPGVESPAGVTETLTITSIGNWSKIKLTFRMYPGLGYDTQTWTGTLKRV